MKEEDLKDLEKKLWESADKMRGAVPVLYNITKV